MFKPLAAGLSGNALVSVAIVAVGLLVIRARHLAVAVLMPIYLLIALVLLSGGANGDMAGAIGVAVKYAYVIVVLIAAFDALRQACQENVIALLISATP